jgi:peptidoglycan/xylan/chitin deacetylase (PgdA/CDA1 family)
MSMIPRSLSIWRRKAGYAWQDSVAWLGLTEPVFKNARGARIVVYHGICSAHPLRFNNIFLQQKTFEEQLLFYKRYFNVVSLDDYYQQRFRGDRLNICIHFDDGYANQLRYVLPLLEKHQLPASFFITAIREAGYDILWNDFLSLLNWYGPASLVFRGERFEKQRGLFYRYSSAGSGVGLREMLIREGFESKAQLMREFGSVIPRHEVEDFWLQMTEEQIKTLSASPRVTIGAHGYYHNDLSKIATADAATEMAGCKRFLEDVTGKEIKALAFPYGEYTAALVESAKRAGFSQILPLGIHHPDATLRERLIINPYVSIPNQMLNLLSKKYDFWR